MILRSTLTSVFLLCTGVAAAQQPARPGEDGQQERNPRTALQLLDERIPEVQFDGAALESVMDWVAEITQANIVVRWQVLEAEGIERDKPVTVKCRNLRLSQVLWLVMSEVGGTDVQLAYRAYGSLLVLSTEQDLGRETVVKVYDVADLLSQPPKFDNAPAVDPSQVLSQQGTSVFQASPRGERDQTDERSPSIDSLVQLITQAIEPETWAVNGNGGSGYIHAFGNVLVVSNSLRVHQRIGGCVEQGTLAP